MNDELTGQLASNTWIIPEYARDMLYLETDMELVPVEGNHGLFELSSPTQTLTLRWAGGGGPALASLRWLPDNLEWDGTVQIGGYVDSLHTTQIPGIPIPITVLSMGGQPLKQECTAYPGHDARRRLPYTKPDFHSGIVASVPETMTTWLVSDGSPLVSVLHNALINNLRIHAWGELAAYETGWDNHFALPLLMKAVTLFTP